MESSVPSRDVFLNYRRRDSAPRARNLYHALSARLGTERVFMDTSSLGAGSEFPKEIADALESAQGMLVIIGLGWLTAGDEFGHRRIDQPNEWVRREIESALARVVKIIPVLVQALLPSWLASRPDKASRCVTTPSAPTWRVPFTSRRTPDSYSDRGSTYAARDYRKALRARGFQGA